MKIETVGKAFATNPDDSRDINPSYMALPGVSDLVKRPNVIETLVCDYLGELLPEVQSRKRHRKLVVCRQIIMFLMREHTQFSLKDIGRRFHRDHTTVIHSLQAVRDQMYTDEVFKKDIDYLESKLQ